MRYYFHVRRSQLTVLDHEGAELADIPEATRRAREIGEALKGVPHDGGSIIVENGSEAIFELPFGAVTG
jgi:hypothetical protein